jgi:hypothetical protein
VVNQVEQSNQQQALEPIEQEAIPFHDEQIIAVRLSDGRIAVVLRWVCESLNIDAHAQVRRIQRTAAIAGELVRVKVQTGGGRQTMPALTLRGFPTWVLGINPSEVKDNPDDGGKAEYIRQMIIAYQVEAVDVLYHYFAQKKQASLVREAASTYTTIVPAGPVAEPVKPADEAADSEKAAYYEHLAAWALWMAAQHNQQWRSTMQSRIDEQEARLEHQEAMSNLLPEIIERLGPETITPQHQGQVRGYVKQLHELTNKPYPTIYDDLRLAFGPARYQDLLEAEWSQIEAWFLTQIEAAKTRKK